MRGHDKNSKEKIREEGRERRVCNLISPPFFYTLIPPFPSLQNPLKIFSIIISKSDSLKKKKSPNITRKVVFFRWNFCASDLEASKNKPHQICVLELQAKGHFRTSTVQVQQLQARFRP